MAIAVRQGILIAVLFRYVRICHFYVALRGSRKRDWCLWRHQGLASGADSTGQRQSVPERVGHRHIPAAPWHFFYSRSGTLVVLCEEILLMGLQLVRFNSHRRAGATVAMMLR